MVAQLPVRLVLPRPLKGCLDSSELPQASASVAEALRQAGTFVLSASPQTDAMLRLGVDSSDGLCQIRAVLNVQERQLEARRALVSGERFVVSPRLASVLGELGKRWLAAVSAGLEIGSNVSSASVALNGLTAGSLPFRMDALRPGKYAIEVAAPGWESVRDTLALAVGTVKQKEYTLVRSRSWLDSVNAAAKAQRRDSIWNVARQRPSSALDGLYAQLLVADLPAGRHPVAILPFETVGLKMTGYDAGTMAAEYGAVRLAGDSRLRLVERAGVNSLLKEQALVLSGAASDSGAAQAGKLLAARYLVCGTVQNNGGTQTIMARMVSVETGEVVSAAVATVGEEKLEELYRTAIGERGQLSSSLYRSAVAPGWGQFYTGHALHGGVALAATLGAIGWIGWSAMEFRDKDEQFSRFRNKDISTVVVGEDAQAWAARGESARSARNDASLQVTYSLAVLGGVWIANLVDAAILGHQDSKRIRTEYFSMIPVAVPTSDGIAMAWRF